MRLGCLFVCLVACLLVLFVCLFVCSVWFVRCWGCYRLAVLGCEGCPFQRTCALTAFVVCVFRGLFAWLLVRLLARTRLYICFAFVSVFVTCRPFRALKDIVCLLFWFASLLACLFVYVCVCLFMYLFRSMTDGLRFAMLLV